MHKLFEPVKRSRHIRAFHTLVFMVAFAAAAPALADEVVTLQYERDAGGAVVSQSYILIHDGDPDIDLPSPVATVILFAGGSGRLRIADEELAIDTANFLVRTRHHFAAQGRFNVAVIDAASDFLDNAQFPRGLRGQRVSPQHLEDMRRVIADLRTRFSGLPVWVIGTSRGSISAAHAAAQLPAPVGPDGLVLTSSVTVPTPGQNSLDDVVLAGVQVPTLIVAHEKDACFVTPPGDSQDIADGLVNAPRVKVRLFDGGFTAISNACGALSEHGFFGIESRVVRRIGKWVLKQSD